MEIKQAYEKRKNIIKKRLKEFKTVKDNSIFYELCFCLLTPGSKAKNCDKVVQELIKSDFLNKNVELNLKSNVRFHNNKGKRLLKAKENFCEISKQIKGKNPKDARDWLINNVEGLGYKEAGHFLRNIGYENLAILDRHILKNLKKYKVIKEIPKTLTKKKYLEIENKFEEFSKKINISMDELDLLFWSFETGEVFK